jgi:hypothetical protein
LLLKPCCCCCCCCCCCYILQEADQLLDILSQLKQDTRKQLTVLLLGKSGSGKSSTLNSLLGEKAAAVSAFKLQPDTESSSTYLRQVRMPPPEGSDSLKHGTLCMLHMQPGHGFVGLGRENCSKDSRTPNSCNSAKLQEQW